MAHEINKQLIDELIAVAFGQRKFDRVKAHELCVGADKELEELERLAKLGKAVEKAFKNGDCVASMESVEAGNFFIDSLEELLEWAEWRE